LDVVKLGMKTFFVNCLIFTLLFKFFGEISSENHEKCATYERTSKGLEQIDLNNKYKLWPYLRNGNDLKNGNTIYGFDAVSL
jgi:hypothetical protein